MLMNLWIVGKKGESQQMIFLMDEKGEIKILTDEQWKQIEEDIDNMSDDEFAEKFLVDQNSVDSALASIKTK